MITTVVVASSENQLANALLSTLRRSSTAVDCTLVPSHQFSGLQSSNNPTACIYVPSARDRDGMLPDLEQAQHVFAQAAGIRQLVLLSSALIYGTDRNRQGLATEDYSVPGNGAGIPEAWQALETSAAEYLKGHSILTILRPSTVLPSASFLARRLSSRLVVTLPGHDPVLQILSVADLANAVLCAVLGAKAGVFNVAPDRVVPLHKAIRGVRGKRIPFLRTLQRVTRRTESLEYLRYPWTISNARIKRELGFSPCKSSLGALLESRGKESPAPDETQCDDFGMDKDYIRFYGNTLFKFLSKVYWRIDDKGVDNIPRSGRAILAGMHRGFMPWDGVMALNLIVEKTGRFPRFLTHPGLLKFPFLANFMTKLGGVIACQESADQVLESNQLLGIFPEGIHGAFTPYSKSYQLKAFGRDAFVKLALRHGAPIVPFVTVGSAEIFPIFGKIRSRLWTRYSEWPFIPLTPTFPLLPVPLPSKWHTQFLAPISVDEYPPEAAADPAVVKAISRKVRTRMQQAINDMLSRRRSIFFGSIFEQRTEKSQTKSVAV
jgi:1-acyl-sn-glycerol-3-phosphate acyltransferase